MEEFSIREQLEMKGIKSALLLYAFQNIPKALFLSESTHSGFFRDVNTDISVLEIEPRVIAIAKMLEELGVKEDEKILITGAESFHILVVLSKIYKHVYAVELSESFTTRAFELLRKFNITNVHIKTGELDSGWEEKAPFNAVLSASEFKTTPNKLKQQLEIGAKFLTPVGPDWAHLMFEIIERVSENEFVTQVLKDTYFVPKPKSPLRISTKAYSETEVVEEIKARSIAFKTLDDFPLDALLERIGDAKVVLLGEASHGTSEFYLTRQEITKALIERKGFNIVSAEADWSDAEQINNYVKNQYESQDWKSFADFPEWMWRNKEVLSFVEWLKVHNSQHNNSIGFYGLDLYGMENSIDLVIKYLQAIDPELAEFAKSRYECMMPFMANPSAYGKMAQSKRFMGCEKEVVKVLFDLLKHKDKLKHSPEYFYAYQNATVVVNAERYYKAMYHGGSASWNLRDTHMFHTLKSLLSYFGKDSKAVVWAHNSHIGDAYSTEMYAGGEINVGHLCREHFGPKSYHIGFGTHTGTVAAADNWGDKMEIMNVNKSVEGSYENLCHQTNVPNFTLPLREEHSGRKLREFLSTPRIERAIGVIYRPKTELRSHYFKAVLPLQFDEYIWHDETKAVTPLTSNSEANKLKFPHPFELRDK